MVSKLWKRVAGFLDLSQGMKINRNVSVVFALVCVHAVGVEDFQPLLLDRLC